jgi:F-box-like
MTMSADRFIPAICSLLQANPSNSPNGVPQAVQQPYLRDRESQRIRVVNQIIHNAKAATATYESIKARYDEQVLVLEKLQSELQAAKALVDSWKGLAASPDLDTQQLQAQLQPILRYPDDHLRLIFEEYVADSKESPFSAAVTLSHVCQRWRDVGISTPRLWNCVKFMGVNNGEALRSKAEAFLERVGRVPAEIMIHIHCPQLTQDTAINPGKVMPFALIYAAPRISTVEFHIFCRNVNPSGIFDAIEHFPGGDVALLRIHLEDRVPAPFSPGTFISKFSGVNTLGLQGFSLELPISPTLSSVLTGIVRLDLKALDNLAITQLLSLVDKNLRILTVKKCQLVPSSESHTELCVMHVLQSLYVDCSGFPWKQIQCPKLAYLMVPKRTSGLEGEYFWEFCSMTETITSADINVDRDDLEQFTRLARSAPNLQKLVIHYPTSRVIGAVLLRHITSDPPFPDLRHLSLTKVHEEFGATTLDGLIQHRWFPRDHPESRMDSGITDALERFEITAEVEPQDWKRSLYLSKYFVKLGGNPSSQQLCRFVGKPICTSDDAN